MTRTWTIVAVLSSSTGLCLAAPQASANQSQSGESLDSLGDARLMNELADRGLDSLLDRYFDVHHIPEAQQRAVRSLQALRELADPSKKLSSSERQRRVKQAVDGLKAILPTIKDPMRVAQDARTLLETGVTPEVNLLEFWGENPTTQARLHPVAQLVYDMFGKCASDAAAEVQALGSRIGSGNAPPALSQRYDQLDSLSNNAKYTQNMCAYYVALSSPMAQREAVVNPALEYLKQFDNSDSQVQPIVRLMMAKLNLVKGNYDEATRLFESIYNDPKKEIQPPPDSDRLYAARYFQAVALLQSGKFKEAQQALDSLVTWEKASMPHDKETQDGVAAAASMLQYRIQLAAADKAADPQSKKKLEEQARQTLITLGNEQPNLKRIIYQQLIERLPKDAAVKDLDPLLLQGLVNKALSEVTKPEGSPRDNQALSRGLEAAQQLVARPLGADVTPAMKDEAARLTPVIQESLGQKVDAARGYLKYAIDNVAGRPKEAQEALEDAGSLIFELRKATPEDADVTRVYDEFLPVAIDKFNKKQLAFYYAQRLRLLQRAPEALKYFTMVPENDKNYPAAQYFTMLAMQDNLENQRQGSPQRPIIAADLVRQAGKVRQLYAGSSDPLSRERSAWALLAEARVVGSEQNNPSRTLELLNGFEASVKGTSNEKVLDSDAMLKRVNAYMALGQLKAATDTLVALLNQSGGTEGAQFVDSLLHQLDHDLEKAEAAGDRKSMAAISKSEAELSGFLVTWVRNNSNEQIRKSVYQYMIFDARNKRVAGTLEQDPAERTRLLDAAMQAYKNLQSPQNFKLYQQTIDPKKIESGDIDPNQPDPRVLNGIAQIDFEMKNFKEASKLLGDLINRGLLGPALRNQGDQVVPNEDYWQAMYELYASNVNAASGPNDPELEGTKQGLKMLLIRGGIPAKYQDKFEELRKQIIPDFNLASLANGWASQPATQQATQPATTR